MHSEKKAHFIQREEVYVLGTSTLMKHFFKGHADWNGKGSKERSPERKGECMLEKKGKWIRSANQNDSFPRDF